MKLLVHLFNLWRKVGDSPPKKKGWYLCTVEFSKNESTVMDLYWYPEKAVWIDNREQMIFNDYDVYAFDEKTNEYSKSVSTGPDCNRTNQVRAWKELPKPYC